MKGLIKKDFLILKSNIKIVLAVFIVMLFLVFQNNGKEAIYLLPLLGIMMFLSTFSYDEFNSWNSYAISLPCGRKNIIKAKYISSIILIIILLAFSIGFDMISCIVASKEINVNIMLSNLFGVVLSLSLVISLLYPLIIKFGSMNGRIIIFVLIMALSTCGYIVSNFVDVNEVTNLLSKLGNIINLLIIVVSISSICISYFISSKIYRNKEF